MRKIETKVQIEKREKRRQVVLSSVLVLLLVMSTAGWAINSFNDSSSENVVEDLGIEFVSQNGVWLTNDFGGTFGFVYLPSEVASVSTDVSKSMNSYMGKTLYYTRQSAGMSELFNNMQGFVLRFQEACVGECELDLPVKDCSVDSIIVFEEGKETSVYEDGNCIYIVGDPVKGADKFLYEILGI